MIYYNIHTHQPSENTDEAAIISLDIRELPSLKTNLYYSAGIHPRYADRDMAELLYTIAKKPFVVAIGEAGLDKRTDTRWELQKDIFLFQINLAEELQKPLIIHSVKAWQELIAIHKISKPAVPWIIHGFRGKGELARQLIQSGFYLSFGRYYQTKALFEAWNSNRLFVETDDKEICIQEIYISISSTLGIAEEALSNEISSHMQSWPSPPFCTEK
ncbi:MAG: TatD family hydrolase [Tannerella sp.]|jgi:TatD DNase family protein|nr:TatD family hydrolase [Tannerella sp.]